jgi:ATP-dependent RNA helicase DeaD
MLIFVRTRQATAELSEKLEARGLASAALSGEMTQVARERTIERLKNGKLDIVVATDVAARGLDVERITHVVNYDIPHDVEGYIHRIGRTGRAGRGGHAILFVTPRERRMLAAIERATRQKVELMRLPSREDVADRRAALFKDSITEVLGSQDLAYFERLVTSYAEEHGREPQTVAAALAYLAQKDRPLLPPPESRREQFTERAPTRAERRSREQPRAAEPRGERRPRAARDDTELVRYRIEVGHEHGVQPGNIVGAIANEAGIDAAHIGRIEIFDSHSIVGLPGGMPKEIYQRLRKAWVCGQQLSISVDSGGEAPKRPPPGIKAKRKQRDHKPKSAQ